jgi:microcystin degradation protein MlrC
MTHRLFTACLGTETNSFSPIPTGISVFEGAMLVRGGRHGERPTLFALPLVVWRERASALGWSVLEGLAAFATPAGDTTRATYEALRDEILGELRAAMPVDAVLLSLHGAMIADGYPDAEGDLLARVRALVGPKVPIGVELDLHCHLSELKLASADAIVIFKEYPHVDVADRAHELFDIVERMLLGGAKPVMAMHDCAMLGIYPTTREPMIGIVARMQALEKEPGILSVSLAHGFPWGDTPEVGTRTLVIAEGDRALAQRVASELGEQVWSARFAMSPPFVTVDEAIDRIVGAGDEAAMPFVLADVADNPGIGAAGDSTFILRQLLARGVGGVALSPLWDPIATAIAFDAGEGASLEMRLGGKMGPGSGEALDVTARVMKVVADAWQPFGAAHSPLGRVAWLRIAGSSESDAIDVVVNDRRVQSFHPACFQVAGIDPHQRRALVVKSTHHFFAGFGPIAREVLYVTTPGTGSMDVAGLALKRVTRPLWPKVANPHARGD